MKTITDESFAEAMNETVQHFGREYGTRSTYVTLVYLKDGRQVAEDTDGIIDADEIDARNYADDQRWVPTCIMAQVLSLHGITAQEMGTHIGTISRVLEDLKKDGHPVEVGTRVAAAADQAQMTADSGENWGAALDVFAHQTR